MPGLLLPLVAWGAAEDISAAPWIDQNGPIVTTGGQTDPFGGTGAALLDDQNPADFARRRRDNVPFKDGTNYVLFAVKKGTSLVGARYRIFDVTGGATRTYVNIDWAGLVATDVSGTGSSVVASMLSLGNSWYGNLVKVLNVVGANNNRVELFPAFNGAAELGSTYFYLRNMVLLDYPDEDKPFDSPPPGSVRVRAPSGIVDRWIPGGRRDYRFKGTLRWIPSAPRAVPQIVSGWDGLNESVGINCGVRAMLEAGQEGNELIWVPDRSNCAVNIPSDLVAPFDKDPYDWENVAGDRKVAIELVNTTTVYPSVL